MRVLIEAPVSPMFGYGNDGIGLVEAFTRAGAEVHLTPSTVQAPLPASVLLALSREPAPPFDLIIRHENPSVLSSVNPALRRASIHGMVGWTMYEWTSLSNMKGHSKFKRGLTNYDALIGYDEVSSEALGEYYKGPIITQQGGYNPDGWVESETRDWDSREFRFAQIGVMDNRKNPFATIAAFTRARAADPEFRRWARLMMKHSGSNLMHPAMTKMFTDVDEDGNEYEAMRLWTEAWPVEKVRAFYDAAHCLVAPSRGEGKNMPALEAMSTGIPVIATDWGGHRQWLSDEWGYRLPYTLEVDDPRHPKALNASVDIDAYADLMLHAFHNRAEVKRKGERAAEVIPQMCSWDNVVERLMQRLRKTLPEGETLWLKYKMGAES